MIKAFFLIHYWEYLLRYCKNEIHLRWEPTIVTTMDVEVDDDCTSTVTRTPITSPTTGFLSRSLSDMIRPAARPPTKRNAELKKSSEQMKRYKRTRSAVIFATVMAIRFALSVPFIPVWSLGSGQHGVAISAATGLSFWRLLASDVSLESLLFLLIVIFSRFCAAIHISN